MRYLVTGASGFIGSALVRALLKNGNDVRALDNESRGSRHRLRDIESQIEWIEGDVRDAAISSRYTGQNVVPVAWTNRTIDLDVIGR